MAMIDAYTIGVKLMLGGDLAEGIKALIPGLEQLNAHLTSANTQADGLAKGLRSIGGAAPGLNRTADALGRINETMTILNQKMQEHREKGGFAFGAVSGVSGRPRESGESGGRSLPALPYGPNFTMPPDGSMEDEPFGGDGRIPLNPDARGEAGKVREARGGHVAGAFDPILSTLLTGELIKNLFGASFDVGAKEAALLSSGWTKEQVDQARALAQQVQLSTPGATIGGGLSILGDLTAVLRTANGGPDTKSAMEALTGLSKDALVLGAHGHGDGIDQVFKAAQAGDLRGVISKPGTDETDPAALRDFVHMITLADTLTKGRVSPQSILQFARTGGTAAAMMSNSEFFGENLALLEGMGSQAAAALQGFNRQFGAGRMSEGAVHELELGFPALAGHWHKIGMGQVMVDPGALLDPEALARSPLKVIHDQLLPGIDRILRGRDSNFDALSPDQKLVSETQEAARLSSTVTGAKLIGEVIRLNPQLLREAAGFQKQTGIDVYGLEQANNPEMRVKALSASFNAFEVSLGEAASAPAIASLNGMTGALNQMAAWSKANPEGSKAALEGLALGIAAMGAAKTMEALTLLTGGGNGKLFLLAGGIMALSGAMDKFPPWLVDLMKGAVAGGTVAGLPGAIAGGVGGSLWNRSPGGWWDKTPGQALHDMWYGSAPAAQPQAYHPEPSNAAFPIIHLTAYTTLDGRMVAKSVTEHQLQMMGGQVSGTLRPDPSIAPQYGAHLVET